MFDAKDNTAAARKDLMWVLEALTQRNQSYLKQRPKTPRLYQSGVKYQVPQQFDGDCEEVRVLRQALGDSANRGAVADVLDTVQAALGGERFRDIGRIIDNNGGDCDNLGCWRAAELRQHGIQASPYMTGRARPDGGTTYHALVIWPPFGNVEYSTTEDPSLILGMGGLGRTVDRLEEIRKNEERSDILKKYGIKYVGKAAPVAPAETSAMESELEDILGMRRRGTIDGAAIAELDRIFGKAK